MPTSTILAAVAATLAALSAVGALAVWLRLRAVERGLSAVWSEARAARAETARQRARLPSPGPSPTAGAAMADPT